MLESAEERCEDLERLLQYKKTKSEYYGWQTGGVSSLVLLQPVLPGMVWAAVNFS